MNRMSQKKIGIMGGTFNPIHTGHLLLAQEALEEAKLTQVCFLPSGVSYLKKDDHILDAVHRLHLTELAVSDNPNFSVSDMEIKRSGNTYTCDTLKQLNEEQPETDFYFILGADCLFSMETWYHPEEIFSSCKILAAVRDDLKLSDLEEKADELRNRFDAEIFLLHLPRIDISSTDIRERLKAGKSIQYMVPEAVRDYILQNHLYQ
ncbi:MAG: nicotinate-nucleotide adenylyltransferase [Lachnospiraceae bacterium]|nr:nicotinate-nucleotide adenylyltransferase [Lachnospiraceae bacterium]